MCDCSLKCIAKRVSRKNMFDVVFVIVKSKPKTVGSFTNINSVGALSRK